MVAQRLFMLFPMLAVLALAAVIDVRTRRIPNWLTFPLALAGLLQTFLPGEHLLSPMQAFLGLLTGLVLNIALFAMHIRGGGDVKLFAALGAWVGPYPTVAVFIVSTLVGAIAALVQAMLAGKLMPLLRNTAVLAVSVAHPRELGVAHVTREDGNFRSVGPHLPYALPMIIATIIVTCFFR